jgi:hypothetical protein
MLPRLGQRLAASPKQGHFDKFDEWKILCRRSLPRIALEHCLTKAAQYGSAKAFDGLPSF